MRIRPGPFTRQKRPSRNTTPRSYSRRTRSEYTRSTTTRTIGTTAAGTTTSRSRTSYSPGLTGSTVSTRPDRDMTRTALSRTTGCGPSATQNSPCTIDPAARSFPIDDPADDRPSPRTGDARHGGAPEVEAQHGKDEQPVMIAVARTSGRRRKPDIGTRRVEQEQGTRTERHQATEAEHDRAAGKRLGRDQGDAQQQQRQPAIVDRQQGQRRQAEQQADAADDARQHETGATARWQRRRCLPAATGRRHWDRRWRRAGACASSAVS